MIITKRKLERILKDLEDDSADQSKAAGSSPEEILKDFYWRCGNANAVNYIKHKLFGKR